MGKLILAQKSSFVRLACEVWRQYSYCSSSSSSSCTRSDTSNRRYLLHLMMIQNLPLELKQIWNFFYRVRPNAFNGKEITIESKPVKKRGKVTWIYSLSCGLNHISRKRKHILLLNIFSTFSGVRPAKIVMRDNWPARSSRLVLTAQNLPDS